MRYHFILAVGAFCLQQSLAAQTVYKGVSADGDVIFSDQPVPNGVAVEIAPPQTYTPPSLPPASNNAMTGETTPAAMTHYDITINAPTSGQTFSTSVDTIEMQLSLSPELQPDDQIRVLLNGDLYGVSDQTTFVLNRLPRGAYQASVEVVDKKDPQKVKGKSSVTFYQQRATVRGG